MQFAEGPAEKVVRAVAEVGKVDVVEMVAGFADGVEYLNLDASVLGLAV